MIEDKNLIEELSQFAWGAKNSFNGASKFIIVLTRKNLTATSEHFTHIFKDIKHFNPERLEEIKKSFDIFQKNDFKLFEEPSKIDDWASKQSYIMLGYMMYTASLLNIDSCTTEDFNIDNCTKILEKYGMNTIEFALSYMVSFGYHKGDIPIKTQKN